MQKKHTLKQDVNSPSNLTFWCHVHPQIQCPQRCQDTAYDKNRLPRWDSASSMGDTRAEQKTPPTPIKRTCSAIDNCQEAIPKKLSIMRTSFFHHPRSSSLEWFLPITYYFEKKINSCLMRCFPPSLPPFPLRLPVVDVGTPPTQPPPPTLVAGRLFREAQGVGKLGKHQGWDGQGN